MKYKVIKVDMNSKYYPERLRQIDDSPKELYCLGNLELLNYKIPYKEISKQTKMSLSTISRLMNKK